jgi:CRISPR-associated protein Cas1
MHPPPPFFIQTVRALLNTIYVMTPQSYVHLENGTVRIDVEREKRLQVPLHHLAGLVTFGNVMISPALIHRLGDEGKSLVLLDEHGRFKARLEGPVSGNILLRQAQHRAANDSKTTLELARACAAGKLKIGALAGRHRLAGAQKGRGHAPTTRHKAANRSPTPRSGQAARARHPRGYEGICLVTCLT